jgi:hypothetical protein
MIESHLNRHDLQWCLRRAPKQVLELMKAHPAQVMCAGGYVRSCISGEKINDMDLFCPTPELSLQFATELAKGGKIYTTGNAHTVPRKRGITIQFIHRWSYDAVADLLASFDFTIACGAFWYYGDSWRSLCHDRFYQDLAARRLIYTSPKRNEDAGGSMLRVLKFYQRGYRIPLDSMGAVIARLNEGVDKDRLNGLLCSGSVENREQAYARVVTGLLREVDPAIDPTHIAHLPSEDENDIA